jgi:hypothetical protein
MLLVAIVQEDLKPVRAFKDDACLYKAYSWAHRHYCLEDMEPKLKPHQLPDWLKITLHMMTQEEFDLMTK